MKRRILILLADAWLFLLASCQLPEPPKITTTDSDKPVSGAQTITVENVTTNLSADGNPLFHSQQQHKFAESQRLRAGFLHNDRFEG